MTPERWEQVNQLFHAVLEHEPGQRSSFLSQLCADDEPLRSEIESLIASHGKADSFIETPASDVAAELLANAQGKLAVGQIIGRYQILSLLGEGGMGEVYLAHDRDLRRQIALKLLPAEFTMKEDRVRRFEQEARAASALNHPNIVTIHEIGQSNGSHFIATEFIEGETLRQRLAGSPSRAPRDPFPADSRMEIGQVLDIATQIASALAAAHAAGIVHRDIKPENIMLRRDGFVKVLDFGLAKLSLQEVKAFDAEAPTESMVKTNPGVVMGTVRYMSPEQARGLDVDARTDIWSLSVVLYEMVTGRTPFEGETPSHTIVSILESDPAPLAHYSNATAELERIVMKALRKKKGERYQSASDIANDLKSLKQELEVEDRLKRSVPPFASGGATTTKSGERGAFETVRTPNVATHPKSSVEYLVGEIKRHRRAVALAALLIAVAVVAYSLYPIGKGNVAPTGEAIDSVAVLPFVNASADPNTEYLSDGISDSVINSLSQLPNFKKVISLNSVLRYKGHQVDPKQVGQELDVRAVLTGRLIQRGDDLMVSTELVDTRDNRRLWGGQYNRKLTDITAVQTEIAQQISETLRLRLSGEDKRRLTKRYTESGEAYQLYVMGRFYGRTYSEKGLQKSIELFEQAIKKDSSYAPAYAGLARTYSLIGYLGLLPSKEARQKEEWAALKAMELDDTLAEAHIAIAHLRALDSNWSAAEEECKRAIELNPNSAEVQTVNALYLIVLGRFDEAMTHLKRAQDLDPLSLVTGADIGTALYYSRQYDRAIEQLQKTIEMDPNFAPAHARLGWAYLAKEMYDEAITAHKKAIALDERSRTTAALGYAYAVAGKRAEALKMLDELKDRAKRRYVSPYDFAVIYLGLSDKDQAFVWLERTYQERSDVLVYIKVSPLYDNLRSDPRFTNLLRRMGLAP